MKKETSLKSGHEKYIFKSDHLEAEEYFKGNLYLIVILFIIVLFCYICVIFVDGKTCSTLLAITHRYTYI